MTFPDPSRLLRTAALPLLNHLLEGQPWLRERLAPFGGRTVRLESMTVTLLLAIEPSGRLVPVDPEVAVDVVMRVPATALLRLLAGDERARGAVDLSGDSALASVLASVLRELRWDVEEDLSSVLGDIPARRLVQSGRTLIAWQRAAAASLLHAVGEFCTEEQPVLAGRNQIEAWARDVDSLRDDVERLDKRLQHLEASRGRR